MRAGSAPFPPSRGVTTCPESRLESASRQEGATKGPRRPEAAGTSRSAGSAGARDTTGPMQAASRLPGSREDIGDPARAGMGSSYL